MELINSSQIREIFGISTNKLWIWRQKGLPHFCVGKSFFYDLDEVKAWMRENAKRSSTQPTKSEVSSHEA